MSSLIVGGLCLAGIGFTGRYLLRYSKQFAKFKDQISLIDLGSKYYRGGFEPKMDRREASLILGVPQTVSSTKLKESHKRIMLLNHPDRGGSPYLAAKINEAKDLLEKK